MAKSVVQERNERLEKVATILGASVAASEIKNRWNVTVAENQAGAIRFDPRARVWLATTGTETTVGDMVGCLRFVICRYQPGKCGLRAGEFL